ncbi:MAG: VOC family protein [Acidobacteriota bacterium]
MPNRVTPFLMFEGCADDAIELYASVFEDVAVLSHERYGADDGGAEGTVKMAVFRLRGQRLIAIDSPTSHDFSFTPSFSLFVDCEDGEELGLIFERLSADGEVLMPVDDYGFGLFGWLNDRFGVSWQLSVGGVVVEGDAPSEAEMEA